MLKPSLLLMSWRSWILVVFHGYDRALFSFWNETIIVERGLLSCTLVEVTARDLNNTFDGDWDDDNDQDVIMLMTMTLVMMTIMMVMMMMMMMMMMIMTHNEWSYCQNCQDHIWSWRRQGCIRAGTVTSVEPEQRKVALFISVPHLP